MAAISRAIYSMKITVLLPTRGRPQLAWRSLQSLINQATEPHNLEILLAIDNDDTDTLKFFTAKRYPVKLLKFERLGYKKLHMYLNTLAKHATGDWFMFWNDDAMMLTRQWDRQIYKHAGEFVLLRMPVKNHPHPFALFPIIPRTWYDLLGVISTTTQADRYIYEIMSRVLVKRCIVDIPVVCYHDRYDLTGNNKDTTYEQRTYMEGDPTNPEHIDHVDTQARIWTSSMVISRYLANLKD